MNVLLIHGSYGKPFENWFPWIEKRLEGNGVSCLIPTFPTPEHQNYSAWSELLDYYVEKGFITNETIVIGHSCGSAFLVKYFNEHNIPIKALITVAGYNHFYSNNHMDELNGSFYFDESDLSTIKSNIKNRVSYYSDNDPFIPMEKLKEFAEQLESDSICIKNAGHFNASAGYTEFEDIFDKIVSLMQK